MSRGSESACCSREHVHISTHSLPAHPVQLTPLGLSLLYLPWLSSHLLFITASLSPKAFPTVRGHSATPANTPFLGNFFLIKIVDS